MKKLLSSTSKRISNHKLGNLPIWDLSDLYDGKHSDLLIMERKEICLRAKKFEKDLGKMLSGMLVNMESRGPDSAGFAIYKKEKSYKCFDVIIFLSFSVSGRK